jgi:hypothetical protein
MELALILREVWARRRVVAIGLLIGAVVATLSVYKLDGFKLKPRALQYSSASTQLFVDTPSTALGNVTQDVTQLQTRATVLANFMASPTIIDLIAKRVGLNGFQIYAAGPVNPNQPRAVIEPTELKRNVQVTGESNPYRMEFLNDPTLPTIGINTQAPTTRMAIALANASVSALQQYVDGLETIGHTPLRSRVVVRPLGQAIGGVVDPGISKKLAAMIFIAIFVLWCGIVLVGARFRQSWKASRGVYDDLAAAASPVSAQVASPVSAQVSTEDEFEAADDRVPALDGREHDELVGEHDELVGEDELVDEDDDRARDEVAALEASAHMSALDDEHERSALRSGMRSLSRPGRRW